MDTRENVIRIGSGNEDEHEIVERMKKLAQMVGVDVLREEPLGTEDLKGNEAILDELQGRMPNRAARRKAARLRAKGVARGK